jgi:hypothetical protein
MIKHVVICGCETLARAQQMKSSFKTWTRKMLRKIKGPIKDQNGWIMRTNDKLQVTHKKPNILTTTKARRLEGLVIW